MSTARATVPFRSSGTVITTLPLQRRAATSTSAGAVDAPPIVHDVLRTSGEPLDHAARAYFEPRFSHDFTQVPNRATMQPHTASRLSVGPAGDQFEREADQASAAVMRGSTAGGRGVDLSQVRIHTDPMAAESARAVNAVAYTVGHDIVFDSGRYSPQTSAGRGLLAHELTHVLQQSEQAPARVQRSPDDEKDLEDYVTFLQTKKKIEGKADSKKKALSLIDIKVNDKIGPGLADDEEYLLILELAAGKPTKAHLDGIMEVLERMGNTSLEKVFTTGKVDLKTLTSLFTGKDKDRLEDFFNRRYEGGLKQVTAGTIKPTGDYVRKGVPLSSIQIIKDTIDWLKKNKKEAAPFFDDVWSKNKIVLLGESHFDDVQRQFAADMLAAKGGKDVGLALEIDIAQAAEVNYYIASGKVKAGSTGWWINDALYKKILDSARATKTQVIPMDTTAESDRDKHMAEEVIKLAKSKSKILVYVGAGHIKEADNAALGEKLAGEFGGNSYALDSSHVPGISADNIYFMIKAAFPADKSIGFDIDASPLAKHPDPSARKKSGMGATLDGYIYFASATAYK